MRTANYTELRKNLREHIDAVIADNDALIVDRGNNTGVVMISLEEYNAIMETEYIMSNQAVLNDIQRSLAEISDGKGVEVDIDSLRRLSFHLRHLNIWNIGAGPVPLPLPKSRPYYRTYPSIRFPVLPSPSR